MQDTCLQHAGGSTDSNLMINSLIHMNTVKSITCAMTVLNNYFLMVLYDGLGWITLHQLLITGPWSDLEKKVRDKVRLEKDAHMMYVITGVTLYSNK